MAASNKNDEVIKLIIEGQNEYSDVSEDVRQELEELSNQAMETRAEFDKLEQSLDLADTYRAQEAEVERLAKAQGEAQKSVAALTKANKEAKGESVELAAKLAKARSEVGALRTATNRAQKAFHSTKETMHKYNIELSSVEENQSDLRHSAEKLGDELTGLQKKQTDLVQSAREQVQVSQKEIKAKEEQRKVLEGVAQVYVKQVEATKKARAESVRVQAETEKLTNEINEQVTALKSGKIGWEDYKRRVGDAGRSADLTRKQVAQISKEMDSQVVAARQANKALQDQAAESKRVEAATEKYRAELQQLVSTYKKGALSAEEFEAAEASIRTKLKLTAQQTEATRQKMRAYSNEIERVPVNHAGASKSTDKLTQVTRRLAQAYTVLLAAQKAAELGASGYRAYTETEDAMLGLQKTTNLTAAEIGGLVDEMSNLSGGVTATAKTELLEIAAAAGRMGVEGADNISSFTKSIVALSSATDLAGEDTAKAIAQILNVTGEAQSSVMGVSASIADLGNTSATTEEQIVHFAKRLASDTATVNLTSAEVLGLSASMAEMGVQAEGASTVVGRTFRFIEEAVKSGGDKLQQLSNVTGLTSEEIEKAFGEDKVKLFSDFVAGIGRMQDGGQTLNEILSDMGIKSDENARILGLLSTKADSLTAAVLRSNSAFEKGTAHFEEMAKKEAALSSGFKRLENRAKNLASVMGEAFSDDLSRGINATAEGNEALEEAMAGLGETAADIVEVLVSMFDAVSGLDDVLETASGGFNLFNAAQLIVQQSLESTTFGISAIVAGISKLAIAWNDFFGDADDVEKWEKIHSDAMDRMGKAADRTIDRYKRLSGESSSAFADLRQAYSETENALEGLDKAQAEAIFNIIHTTGYIEGNDKAYRELTRAIQRNAEEKRIFKELTAEENNQIQAHIRLLKAQGVEEKEAAVIAKNAAIQKKESTEITNKADTSREDAAARLEAHLSKLATAEEKYATAVDNASGSTIKQAAAERSRAEALSESAESMADYEQKVNSYFRNLVDAGQASGSKLVDDFNASLQQLKTKESIDLLVSELRRAAEAGAITGKELEEALSKSGEKLRDIAVDLGKAWEALDLDVNEVTKSLTTQGIEAANAFSSLVESGVYTSEQLRVAFDAALSKTTTVKDVELLIDVLKKAEEQGVITGEALQEAMDLASGKVKEAASKIDDAFAELGLNMEEVTNQITEKSRKATDAFGLIASEGKLSAAAISKSFEAAFNKAKTVSDLENLREKIEELGHSGKLSGDALRQQLSAVDDKAKVLKGTFDKAGSSVSTVAKEVKSLNSEIESTGTIGKGAIGDLIKEIRELVQEVGKLADGFKSAGDEAEKMAEKAATEQADSEASKGKQRSMASQIAEQYRAQGRDDVAEILLQNQASGKNALPGAAYGLEGQKSYWERAKKLAEDAADAEKERYDELAKYQLAIAAGDKSQASYFLSVSNQFADLKADLVSMVAAASALVNGSPQSNAGQQVIQPNASTVTIDFRIGGSPVASGDFSRTGAEELISQLSSVASISK